MSMSPEECARRIVEIADSGDHGEAAILEVTQLLFGQDARLMTPEEEVQTFGHVIFDEPGRETA